MIQELNNNMNKLLLHISSGGVVYKKEGGKVFIALLGWYRKWGQLWMCPKETVEEKDASGRDFESKPVLKKAASRALKEEMNIEGKIEDYVGDIQEKVTFEGVRKERHIHYFLIRYTQGELKNSWEHDTVRWFPRDKVLGLRLKKGEAEVVDKALKKIQ